jgi:hypothetical protein
MHGPFSWRRYLKRREDPYCGCPGATPGGFCEGNPPTGTSSIRILVPTQCGSDDDGGVGIPECYLGSPVDLPVRQTVGPCEPISAGGGIALDCPGCPKEQLMEFPFVCERDYKVPGYSGQSYAACQIWSATSTFTMGLSATSPFDGGFISVTGPYYFLPARNGSGGGDEPNPSVIKSGYLCMEFSNAGMGDAFRRVQVISGRNRDRYTGPICAHYRLGAKGNNCFGESDYPFGGMTALGGPLFGLTHFGELQIGITRGTSAAAGQSPFGGTFPMEDLVMDLPLFGALRRENPLCPTCLDRRCCDRPESYDEEGRLLGVCRYPGEEDLTCFSCRPGYRGYPALPGEGEDDLASRGESGDWGFGHFGPIDLGPTSGYFSFACFNANGWLQFNPTDIDALPGGLTSIHNRLDFPAMSVYSMIKGVRNYIVNAERMKRASIDKYQSEIGGFVPTYEDCISQYPCLFDINCTGNDSQNNQGDSWWNTIDPGATSDRGIVNLSKVMAELRKRVNNFKSLPVLRTYDDPFANWGCFTGSYEPYKIVTPNVFMWDRTRFLDPHCSVADKWKHIYIVGNPNIIYDTGCDSSYGNTETSILYVDETMHQEGVNQNGAMRLLSWMGCDGREHCDETQTDIRLLRCDGQELDTPAEGGLSSEFNCQYCYNDLEFENCEDSPLWRGMLTDSVSSTGANWGNCCRDLTRLPTNVPVDPARAVGAFGNEGLGGILVVPSNGSLALFRQQSYGSDAYYSDFDGLVDGPAGDNQSGTINGLAGESVPRFLRQVDSCTGVASGFCKWPIAILSGKTGGITGEIFNFGYEWTKIKGTPIIGFARGASDIVLPGTGANTLTGNKIWAATHHVAVLRGNKGLTCYGLNNSGQCNIPSSLISSQFADAIAVGRDYYLEDIVKRSDGITANTFTGHTNYCCPKNCALTVYGSGPYRQVRCFCDGDGLSGTDIVGAEDLTIAPGTTFCLPLGPQGQTGTNLTFNNRWIEARTMGILDEAGGSGDLYGWGDNSCGTINWPPPLYNESTDLARICVKYTLEPSTGLVDENGGSTGNCCLQSRRCSLVQTRSRRRGGLNRFFRSRRRWYQWRCSDGVSVTAYFPEAAFVQKPSPLGKCLKVTGTRTQTCVVKKDGSVACWGLQGMNTFPTSFPRMEACSAGCGYTNYSDPNLRTSCTVPTELTAPDSTLDVVCVETEAEDIITHYSGNYSGERYLIVPWSGCVALTSAGKLKIWGNWYRPEDPQSHGNQCGSTYNSAQWCFNDKLAWINNYASQSGQKIVKIEECRGGVICLHEDGYVSVLSANSSYTPYFEGGPPNPTFKPRALPKRVNYGKDERVLCEYVYNCAYIPP